jgi:hypothetical protein
MTEWLRAGPSETIAATHNPFNRVANGILFGVRNCCRTFDRSLVNPWSTHAPISPGSYHFCCRKCGGTVVQVKRPGVPTARLLWLVISTPCERHAAGIDGWLGRDSNRPQT